LSSVFGKLFPLGVAFIIVGMFLMMVASILSVPSSGGGGAIVIFPFFIGTVSESLAIVLMVVFIIISLIFMFLPWILGPRRILRIFEGIAGVKDEGTSGVMSGSKGEVEDYLVTLKMPGFKESDIDVQVFNSDLIVQAYKDGEVFRRTYNLPRGFEPKGIKYKYEDGFLVINVSLKRKEET